MDMLLIALTVASLTSAVSLIFMMNISVQINKIESLLEEVVYGNKIKMENVKKTKTEKTEV